MNTLLFLTALVAVAASHVANRELDGHWELFKKTFEKEYSSREELVRRMNFEDMVKKIQEHNLLADLGIKTYRVGINKYSDLTDEEYKAQLLGFAKTTLPAPGCGQTYKLSGKTIPDMVDWRTKGYVTPVKDQKACGSCWAFSSTGSLEGQHFKKTGKLVSLSEQNLVDCSMKQGNAGCGGGLMDNAFKYIKINNGIDTETSYPYVAKNQNCSFNKMNVGATDTGCWDIAKGQEADLKDAVANVGPISVAIDAMGFGFRSYKSGVYSEPFCSQDRLDHGVLAVGYGSENGMDYWIVKNSWGLSYGDKGYIMMRRNEYNQCGIATQASYPTV